MQGARRSSLYQGGLRMAIKITSSDILTPEQISTHLRIFAGPGAGKTHFLVENVKNIVTTHPLVAKSRARKVLCVTYTNAAVEEIQRRLNRFSDSVEVFTIHGFIIEHIIKPFQKDLYKIILEEFDIDVGAKKPITSQIEGLGILHGIEKEDVYEFVASITSECDALDYSKKSMGDIQVDIKHFFEQRHDKDFKVQLSVPSRVADHHVLPIKEFVWSVARKLSHDEILYFGYRILERNSTALYALRVKFPFIFLDEFQDTNPLQTLLIKLLGRKSTIVGVIGDVAQSIYSFQGARPSQFNELSFEGSTSLVDYSISGNRRSIENIVDFCNFIRKSDTLVQKSIRPYADEREKIAAEARTVHFLVGDSDTIKQTITSVIEDGGVVLTRAWAKAFSYIRGIDDEQVKLLAAIYNSYYNSPIDIRTEIAEMGNVTWVRAFKFIFSFHNAFSSGSFIDAVKAFGLYADIDRRKLSIKILRQIKMLADDTFAELTDITTTVPVIEALGAKLSDKKYTLLRSELLGNDFAVPVFDEYDLTSGSTNSAKFIDNLSKLTWDTSYKLFTEVFSPNSSYMTVHQAKGLEWKKVIVSVEPNRFDKTKISDVYADPRILQETPAEEFVRMYYVACSRAEEDLYVHLPSGFDESLIAGAFQNTRSYEIVR
jgi:superfamily I DNA/RNA helicase